MSPRTRKTLIIICSVALALVFNMMYDASTILWDAYAYEINVISEADPGIGIELTEALMERYPVLSQVLESVRENEVVVVTPDDSRFDGMNSFAEGTRVMDESGHAYLIHEGEVFMIALITYGGVYREEIYRWLSVLSLAPVLVIVIQKAWRLMKEQQGSAEASA